MRKKEDKVLVVSPEAVYQNAIEKGLYDGNPTFGEMMARIHAEVSEALEANAKEIAEGEKGWRGEELGDIALKAFSVAEHFGIDIIYEMNKKHEYNKTRPYRHGGKIC